MGFNSGFKGLKNHKITLCILKLRRICIFHFSFDYRPRCIVVSTGAEDWSGTLCLYEWLYLYTTVNSTSLPTHCDIDSYTILPHYVLFTIFFPYPSLWFIIESRNFSPLLHLLLLFQRIPPLSPIITPFLHSCSALCVPSFTKNLVYSPPIVSSFVRNKWRTENV